MDPKPTIGRIVQYTAPSSGPYLGAEGQVFPAIIVNVWTDTCVNLQVFRDGEGTTYLTSVTQGDVPGQWNWPTRD